MANPDLILFNGTIFTRPDSRARTEAVAVWNGRVTDVGRDRDVLRLRARSVKTLDLRQRVVIPGLSDSHVHLLGYGKFLRTLDLTRTRSVQQLHRVVAKAAKRLPKKAWVTGRGWDQENLKEHRFLNRQDLATFTSHPVFLRRICGHVAVANDLALSLARISRETRDPEGGEIARDPLSGEPTGLLKESAVELVERSIPETDSNIKESLIYAAQRLLRLGLTSLHCIVENSAELKILHSLKNEGKIKQSIYAILPLGLLDQVSAMGLTGDRRAGEFRTGAFKVYLDGSLGARTAALSEPYSDDPSNVGMLRLDFDQIIDAIEKASSSGFQLCAHAIGDRAVEAAVSAFEKTLSPAESRPLRHRIEHCSLTRLSLIRRMRRAGLVASVQPPFIYSDSWASERLGSRRVGSLYPFRSMLRAGLNVAFGSDCPADNPNPFKGLWAAAARPGSTPSQRLSVSAGLACYTYGSAFASFSEGETGTLEPGKRADMVLLDRDPFTCGLNALRNTRVIETVVNGRIQP